MNRAAIWTTVMCAGMGGVARGQNQQQRPKPLQGGGEGQVLQPRRLIQAPMVNTPRGMGVGAYGRFSLTRDVEAEQWLKKAQVAGDRQEWKLAIDTLWRVIDQYGEAIVSPDGKTGGAASEIAWAMLREWPPAAMEAYRTIYEPEAARLLSDAEKRGSIEGLRLVASRYLLTRSGAEALDRIATWSLDAGRPFEAMAALRRLQSLPETVVPKWRVTLRLAVAEAEAGRRSRAEKLLDELRAGAASQPAEKLPEKFGELVDAVGKFVAAEKEPKSSGGGTLARWAGLLGGGDCDGRMPAVNPSLDVPFSWRMGLPGMTEADGSKLTKLCEQAVVAPVWQMAAEGALVFVRFAGGAMALDATTFEPTWQARTRSRERSRFPSFRGGFVQIGGQEATGSGPVLDGVEVRALTDELSGAVGLSQGLLFVVEPPREVVEGSAVFGQLGGQRFLAVDNGSGELSENTIQAFDAATGKLLWAKGADGPLNEGLAQAHFFSPPVACGAVLVAPFASGEEFSLAIMTREGRLVKAVTLGSAPQGAMPGKAVLQPTAADPFLYVPTGAGAMLALGSGDLSLRWVFNYDRRVNREGSEMVLTRLSPASPIMATALTPTTWASNPPVVAGGLVLLAPTDGSKLYAIDRETGSRRWAAPRKDHRFVIGADASRVYVSGTRVEAINLADGSSAWEFGDAKPIGRAGLSGGRIYVPVKSGLVVLEAESGKRLAAYPNGPDRTSFGNVLAWDGSLYSLSPTELERIPDLVQLVALAEAQLEKQPNDRDALLRLAVLESQRGNLNKTQGLLKRAREATGAGTDERLDDQIDHMWVETELELARGAAPEERMSLVRSAADAARRPGDVMRAELTLLDIDAAEGGEKAFSRGLDLLGRIGGEAVELEGGLTSEAWVAISERLERLWGDADVEARGRLSASIEEMIGKSKSRGDRIRLSDALGFAPAAARLDLALGRELASEGALESAEFFWTRAAGRTSHEDRATAVAAYCELVKLHLDPGEALPLRRDSAATELSALSNEDAELRVGAGTLGEFIDTWKAKLNAARGGAGQTGTTYDGWAVIDSRQRTFSDSTTSAFHPNSGTTDGLAVVCFARQLMGLDMWSPESRAIAWSSNLADSASLFQNRLMSQYNPSQAASVDDDGTIAGSVAMVPADGPYYPIGLITGRQMGPPLVPTPGSGWSVDGRVVTADGWFVAALDAHTIVGWPAREWTGPVWQREFRGATIASLHATDGAVVVLDREQTSAVVLRARSGRLQSRIRYGGNSGAGSPELEEGDGGSSATACVGSYICHLRGNTLSAWHAASGRPLWQVDVPPATDRLDVLDERHVGVSCAPSRYLVIDAGDGQTRTDLQLEDSVVPPESAAIEHGRLYLFLRLGPSSSQSRLAAYDVSSGMMNWSIGPMTQTLVTDRQLRASPRVIPYVESVEITPVNEAIVRQQFDSNSTRYTGRLRLIDKSTGSRIGSPIVLSGGALNISGQVLDVLMFERRAVITSMNGYFVVGPRPDTAAEPAEPSEGANR